MARALTGMRVLLIVSLLLAGAAGLSAQGASRPIVLLHAVRVSVRVPPAFAGAGSPQAAPMAAEASQPASSQEVEIADPHASGAGARVICGTAQPPTGPWSSGSAHEPVAAGISARWGADGFPGGWILFAVRPPRAAHAAAQYSRPPPPVV